MFAPDHTPPGMFSKSDCINLIWRGVSAARVWSCVGAKYNEKEGTLYITLDAHNEDDADRLLEHVGASMGDKPATLWVGVETRIVSNSAA